VLKNTTVDYVTFVPDGEPTLDANLGVEVTGIRGLGARVAVITNSSLLWMEDVRRDLLEASLVSVKVDSVDPGEWRRINRPHPSLRLDSILEGLRLFAREYKGILYSETMLVDGVTTLEGAGGYSQVPQGDRCLESLHSYTSEAPGRGMG